MQLSNNFYLSEFLHSQTAERKGGAVKEAQYNPSDEVIANLGYLARQGIQPLRTLLAASITISSGYRCDELNKLIGGSPRSQHRFGQAADLKLSNGFIHREKHSREREVVESMVKDRIGRSLRADVNSNFYLFALACLYLDRLDVDQVIHEYGTPGAPRWIHLSNSKGDAKNKRQILLIAKDDRRQLSVEEALALGC